MQRMENQIIDGPHPWRAARTWQSMIRTWIWGKILECFWMQEGKGRKMKEKDSINLNNIANLKIHKNSSSKVAFPSGEAWSRASNTLTRIQFLSIFLLCLFKFFPLWTLSFPPHHIICPAPVYAFNACTVGDLEEVLRESSALNFEGRICIGLAIGLHTCQQRVSFSKAWQSKATGKFEKLQIVRCCWRTEFIWGNSVSYAGWWGSQWPCPELSWGGGTLFWRSCTMILSWVCNNNLAGENWVLSQDCKESIPGTHVWWDCDMVRFI